MANNYTEIMKIVNQGNKMGLSNGRNLLDMG